MGSINLAAIAGISALLMFSSNADAQSWINSPHNWKNSYNNWENSPNNWKNSPNNWKNSENNYNNRNGVYSPDGKRIGYGVVRSDGSGINYYDNSGNPLGYQNFEQ